MKFLICGCNGMAGHMIGLYLLEQGYEVEGFARNDVGYIKTIIGDARDIEYVKQIIFEKNYDIIVNCIGILNNFAENDHEAAVFLNAYFPWMLSKITENTKIQLIHISTDCVFSGDRGGYRENDFPDGKSFYDRSKALGEIINNKDITFRTSIVGPDMNRNGIGLLNWFMQQEKKVKGFKNVIWTGMTTLQLAKTIEIASKRCLYGLYNMVPEQNISKFELLIMFNHYFRNSSIEIEPDETVHINKSLTRTNYNRFSYIVPGYEEQIKELAEWMSKYKKLYPHYL